MARTVHLEKTIIAYGDSLICNQETTCHEKSHYHLNRRGLRPGAQVAPKSVDKPAAAVKTAAGQAQSVSQETAKPAAKTATQTTQAQVAPKSVDKPAAAVKTEAKEVKQTGVKKKGQETGKKAAKVGKKAKKKADCPKEKTPKAEKKQ